MERQPAQPTPQEILDYIRRALSDALQMSLRAAPNASAAVKRLAFYETHEHHVHKAPEA